MVEARARHRLPGRAEFVEIKACRDLSHLFERQHGGFGALCTLDLGFEFVGVDFGAIGGCDKRPNFVGGAVECGRFALGGAVEQVDEGPAKTLGVGLERGPGNEREEIGPDRFERLNDGFANRKITARNRGGTDRKC